MAYAAASSRGSNSAGNRSSRSRCRRVAHSRAAAWSTRALIFGTEARSERAVGRRVGRVGGVAWRRFGAHRAHEQVEERGPLRGTQPAEQLVLDIAEPGVGEREL